MIPLKSQVVLVRKHLPFDTQCSSPFKINILAKEDGLNLRNYQRRLQNTTFEYNHSETTTSLLCKKYQAATYILIGY